jgi:hypothetical protein
MWFAASALLALSTAAQAGDRREGDDWYDGDRPGQPRRGSVAVASARIADCGRPDLADCRPPDDTLTRISTAAALTYRGLVPLFR